MGGPQPLFTQARQGTVAKVVRKLEGGVISGLFEAISGVGALAEITPWKVTARS